MTLKIKVLGNASRIGFPPVEARPGYVITLDPSCDDYDWLVVFDELPLDDRGTCRGGEMPCLRAVSFTRAGRCAGIRRRRRLKTCCGICGG